MGQEQRIHSTRQAHPMIVRVGGTELRRGNSSNVAARAINEESLIATVHAVDSLRDPSNETPRDAMTETAKPDLAPPFWHQVLQGTRRFLKRSQGKLLRSLDILLQPTQPEPFLFPSDKQTSGSIVQPFQGPPPHRRRRAGGLGSVIKNSFQFGLIVGLGLGCCSLVLYHNIGKMAVSLPPEQQPIAMTTTYLTSEHLLTVPAVRLYALQYWEAPSDTALLKEEQKLAAQHVSPVALHHDGYRLIGQVAVRSSTLEQLQGPLKQKGIQTQVIRLDWPVVQVPTAAGSNAQTVRATSQWLTADITALNTLVASLMDQAPAADAWTAYRSARQYVPTIAQMGDVGYEPLLRVINDDTIAAFRTAASGKSQSALQFVLKAYAALEELSAPVQGNNP